MEELYAGENVTAASRILSTLETFLKVEQGRKEGRKKRVKERDGAWNGKLAGYYHNKVNAQPYGKQTVPFERFLGYRHCAEVIAEPTKKGTLTN